MKYQRRIIAFLDILGFKNLVNNKELDEILDILKDFSLAEQYPHSFHPLCPCSEREKDDCDFKITQISDSLIISAELTNFGMINLIYFCHRSLYKLLSRGLLCRGYITVGNIYHETNQIIGEGYIRAYEYDAEKKTTFSVLENVEIEKGTPFVEIDNDVIDKLYSSNDPCIIEMSKRITKTVENTTALYPLNILSQGSEIENFNGDIATLNKFKILIEKHTNNENEKVLQKSKQHLKIIEGLIQENTQAIKNQELLLNPFPFKTVKDLKQ